ncbi:phosphoglycerate kinase [Candidatus Wolfebacteria bacterium]|nr:MAG: phosphoglycerate kinase [Candidatus Wolfebacteria bacterium]
MKSIKEIESLQGKKVLVRVDFNVPIQDGVVLDDFRIRATLPTIKFLKEHGAKIILISHVGRDSQMSFQPIVPTISKYIDHTFISHTTGEEVEHAINSMSNGEVILLENLRGNEGEISNDETFAKALASFADIYVNEAFSVSHRMHASIVGVPQYIDGYSGLQFDKEVENLKKVLEKPDHPFLFIIGGAKFKTKIPLIEKFLDAADHIYITGALVNTFYKEEGFEVGTSLVSDQAYDLHNVLKNKKIILASDVVVMKEDKIEVKKFNEVEKDEMIVDIGPESFKELEKLVSNSTFILWNGPLGYYEHGFKDSTENLVKVLSQSDSKTIVGGGDTVALISKLKLEDSFSFVSSGGGAMLEFLQKGTLPGIEALKQ